MFLFILSYCDDTDICYSWCHDMVIIKDVDEINNNNNNYKTSTTPVSSKRIELSGAPSTGVGQTHSLGTI